ncbi:hypothetical protein Tco_0661964 [Tanacetum coccineum]
MLKIKLILNHLPKKKTATTAKGKRVKTSAKAAKPAKKKQPVKTSKAKSITVISEVALTEAEQMKLATKRSLIQTHSSHANGSGADEGTGDDDDQEHDDQDDDNEQTDSDNDGDDFVHPKFSTHDEEDKEKDSFDPRVQTPSYVELTDEEIQDVNVEGEEMDEQATNEEDVGNELYRDVNINLEGRDIEMTDAQQTNVQTTQVIEDTHVIITPVNPEGQ